MADLRAQIEDRVRERLATGPTGAELVEAAVELVELFACDCPMRGASDRLTYEPPAMKSEPIPPGRDWAWALADRHVRQGVGDSEDERRERLAQLLREVRDG